MIASVLLCVVGAIYLKDCVVCVYIIYIHTYLYALCNEDSVGAFILWCLMIDQCCIDVSPLINNNNNNNKLYLYSAF